MILLTIAASVLIIFVYSKLFKPLSHWKDRGVVHKKPWPLIGNSAGIFLQRKSFFEFVKDVYQEFPNKRYFGVHQFNNPALYVRDLELIKKVAVKDFDHFTDHTTFVSEEIEPLMGRNLFNLNGQQWRDMRSTITPTFTSGKMKMLFHFISDCASQFTGHLEENCENLVNIELKEIITRVTNDVIASVAFGVTCNSLKDKDNEFYTMGKRATAVGGEKFIRLALFNFFPILAKIVNPRLIPPSVSQFFCGIVKESISKRQHEGIVRHDMIHLLMEARKGSLSDDKKKPPLELTDDDITAQALFFFFGGFESSASLMSFMAYELAMNPDVQQKLQKEIDEVEKASYEVISRMKYLDMVVSETLRKWPPGFQIDRVCVKNYDIEAINAWEKPLTIEKGTLVLIPVVGIHHDPNYFPNPDVFDPERFCEGNKHNIKSAYFPFGIGPRSCIGSRFAIMECKVVMYHLLLKFDIMETNKTPAPLKIDKKAFLNLGPKEGFWLGLKLRNTN